MVKNETLKQVEMVVIERGLIGVEKRLKERPAVPRETDHFCQTVEETGEEENTGFLGGGLGTGK